LTKNKTSPEKLLHYPTTAVHSWCKYKQSLFWLFIERYTQFYAKVSQLHSRLTLIPEDMIPSITQITLWQERLATLSNQDLVETYNREVLCKGWGTSRGYYLICLQKEIEQRRFDASIVLNRKEKGEVESISLAYPVTLDTIHLKLIAKKN